MSEIKRIGVMTGGGGLLMAVKIFQFFLREGLYRFSKSEYTKIDREERWCLYGRLY